MNIRSLSLAAVVALSKSSSDRTGSRFDLFNHVAHLDTCTRRGTMAFDSDHHRPVPPCFKSESTDNLGRYIGDGYAPAFLSTLVALK